MESSNKAFLKTNQSARIAITIIWVGAAILLLSMLYKWHQTDGIFSGKRNIKDAKDLFVDELLLIPGELKLESSSPLINIKLNQAGKSVITDKTETSITTERNVVYDKILEEKIKKVAKKQPSEDFSIKPLPK